MRSIILIISVLVSVTAKTEILHTQQNTGKIQKSAYIVVSDHSNLIKGKIVLFTFDSLLTSDDLYFKRDKFTQISGSNKNNNYDFFIHQLNGHQYFSLRIDEDIKGENKNFPIFVLEHYLLSPGDSVTITIEKNIEYDSVINREGAFRNDGYYTYIYRYHDTKIFFSGKGSAKMQCKYEADRQTSAPIGPIDLYNTYTREFNKNNVSTLGLAMSLSLLYSYKHKIQKDVYDLMRLDFIGTFSYRWHKRFYRDWLGYFKNNSISSSLKDSVIQFLTEKFQHEEAESASVQTQFNSAFYLRSVNMRVLNKSLFLDNSLPATYHTLRVNYAYPLNQKLVAIFLSSYYEFMDSDISDSLLNNALSFVKIANLRERISGLSNGLKTKSLAYNFSLPNEEGDTIRMSDFKNKIVLMDFWYKGCGACADYYQEVLADIEESFHNDPRVVFVTVNVDKDKERWMEALRSGKYTSHKAINVSTYGLGYAHSIIKYYNIFGYPRPIIFDQEGRVFNASQKNLRTKEGIMQQFDALLKREQ